MRTLVLITAMLLLSLFSWSAALGEMPPAEQIIERLQARYQEVTTVSADFTQVYHGFQAEQRESGRLVLKKPDKMHWEYSDPTPKLFVSDGKQTFFYVPDERQVMISEFEASALDTPLMFLFGQGEIGEHFVASIEDEDEKFEDRNYLVRLVPKRPRGEFSRVVLEIDPETYLIDRLTVIEPIGNRNHYILQNVELNVRISDKKFRFKIPKGTEVIRN